MQLLYGSIYNVELVELEMLKIYTKTNLASSFIKLFKLYYYFNIIYLKNKG